MLTEQYGSHRPLAVVSLAGMFLAPMTAWSTFQFHPEPPLVAQFVVSCALLLVAVIGAHLLVLSDSLHPINCLFFLVVHG